MDTARHAGVGGHVFVQGLQQGIMHAGIDFPVPGNGRLPHGRKAVQHSADGRVLDVCLLFWCLLFWCRVPGRFRRELPRRQIRPGDVGRGARRLRLRPAGGWIGAWFSCWFGSVMSPA